MSGPGQRLGRHVGDVADVGERLANRAGRQDDLAVEHRVKQVVLAEVLAEPARPDDRPAGAGGLDRAFGRLRFRLAPAREQHQLAHAHAGGERSELTDRRGRAAATAVVRAFAEVARCSRASSMG